MKIKHLILGAVLVLAATPITSVHASTQDFYFKDFTADYYLARLEDGSSNLHVKEVMTAMFPDANQNHGITRSIPTTNQNGKNKVVQSKDALNLTVLRNGEPENINKIEDAGSYYTIYLGDADTYVHGEQVYTLEYDYTDVITEFDADGNNVSGVNGVEKAFQELYWDTNGTNWKQKFGKVTANLHMPSDIYEKMDKKAWCYVGKYGESGQDRCSITATADGFSFAASDLSAYENLTFVTEFAPDTFTVIIRKNYILVIILVVVIVLAAAMIIWSIMRWRKDAKPKYDIYKKIFVAPEYQPPKDPAMHTAEGAQIYLKKTKSPYVATLLELAVGKKVTIRKVENERKYDWSVILNVEPAELTDSQKEMMNILSGDGKYEKGDEIPIQKHTATTYLSKCAKNYTEKADGVLEKNGYLIKRERKMSTASLIVLVIIAIIVFALPVMRGHIGNIMDLPAFSDNGILVGSEIVPLLLPITIVVAIIVVAKISQHKAKYAKYTEKGLKMARYLEGLELYIKMAEKERLEFLQSVKGADTSTTGIVKLYEKLLPWAALFGEEKSWAKELAKYYELEDVDGAINVSVMNGIIASHMIRDIDRAFVTSTGYSNAGGGGSSFYSGGGGGGFSGGGGGGGGGGGW